MKYTATFDIPDGYKIGCATAKICPDDGKVRTDEEFEDAYADTVPVQEKQIMSVASDIIALALINIQDIFKFTITAKDEEIKERYGSEAMALDVAESYLSIATRASLLQNHISGWRMNYSMPLKDSDERIKKTAYFYDDTGVSE